MYTPLEIWLTVFALVGAKQIAGKIIVWLFRNNLNVKKKAVKGIERELNKLKQEIKDLELEK